MLVVDANVLIQAFRSDAERHAEALSWLQDLDQFTPIAVPDVCFSALIRITTNRRVFPDAAPMEMVLDFANEVRARPGFRSLHPGPGHWPLFGQFCRLPGIAGNDVTDAYLAALVAERNDELVTYDRGFARFPGLRWRHPSE